MELEVRQLKSGSVEEAAGLQGLIFSDQEAYSFESLYLLYQVQGGLWMGAYERGRLVGLSVNALGLEGISWIMSLGVLPAYRGRGLGRELLTSSLARLKLAGAYEVRLTVLPNNHQALGLYHSLGFQTTEKLEAYLGIEAPRYLMSRELKGSH